MPNRTDHSGFRDPLLTWYLTPLLRLRFLFLVLIAAERIAVILTVSSSSSSSSSSPSSTTRDAAASPTQPMTSPTSPLPLPPLSPHSVPCAILSPPAFVSLALLSTFPSPSHPISISLSLTPVYANTGLWMFRFPPLEAKNPSNTDRQFCSVQTDRRTEKCGGFVFCARLSPD